MSGPVKLMTYLLILHTISIVFHAIYPDLVFPTNTLFSVISLFCDIRYFIVWTDFLIGMDSLLEVQRNCHEERERCIDLMTKEFLIDKKTVVVILYMHHTKMSLISIPTLATRKD